MSATIPSCVAVSPWHERLTGAGLNRIHQGKVRDTYALLDPERLLVVATNRVSINDFVLPALMPHKGELLTAMTVFWLDDVFHHENHHLIAFGRGVGHHLPSALCGDDELFKCSLVVRRLTIIPVECVVRGYLTGSGWREYQKTGEVFGNKLPPGLHDGSRLPEPIFTPTTKAESGHDENLSIGEVVRQYGSWIRDFSLHLYTEGAARAKEKGWIIADTKFELGDQGDLADEALTPDSSRFWKEEEWLEAVKQRKSPPSYDKEIVRTWGKGVSTPVSEAGGEPGLHNLDPENPEHLDFVSKLTVPQEVLLKTENRYRLVLEELTGLTLEEFQKEKLGCAV
ncbi:MAG: phosphoribosylaminoimidazolesuccinocarboxamide synthase [bacterium]|nr:phosphoribosylaminoimidazolesuccinocarboxamide synthase [bacterium]